MKEIIIIVLLFGFAGNAFGKTEEVPFVRDQKSLLDSVGFECIWAKEIKLGWGNNNLSDMEPHNPAYYIDSVDHKMKSARGVIVGKAGVSGGQDLKVSIFSSGIIFSDEFDELGVVSSEIIIFDLKTDPRSVTPEYPELIKQLGFYATSISYMNGGGILLDPQATPGLKIKLVILPTIISRIGKCYVVSSTS